MRVSLAWSSHTSGTSNLGKTDVLRADLDLVIRQPNGTTTGSFSFDNSYEVGRRHRVEHRDDANHRAPRSIRRHQEPFGLAWALTSPFTDIEGSKYYSQILWVAQRSIMAGCTSTRFCPDSSLTRGQLAKSLDRGPGPAADQHRLLLRRREQPLRGRDQPPHGGGSDERLRRRQILPGRVGAPRPAGRPPWPGRFACRQPARDYFGDDDGSPHEAEYQPRRRRRHRAAAAALAATARRTSA